VKKKMMGDKPEKIIADAESSEARKRAAEKVLEADRISKDEELMSEIHKLMKEKGMMHEMDEKPGSLDELKKLKRKKQDLELYGDGEE
jgi:hypothetical protein